MATDTLDFSVVIHGGAGVIAETDTVAGEYMDSLKETVATVYRWAKEDTTRTAVDITGFAVTLLENNPKFNAGLGSVFTADETHEMEASIMDGSNLKCGAASLLTKVKNPVKLARVMLDNPFHIWCAGAAAEAHAANKGLEIVDSNSYFSMPHRKAQLEMAKELRRVVNDHDKAVGGASGSFGGGIRITRAASEHDVELGQKVLLNGFLVPDQPSDDSDSDDYKTETVGCVAMRGGHVSAATSTGGMTNKMCGRIGDTPIIGSGTYADDRYCAVSATGKGEEFMRRVVAYDISARMKYTGASLGDACRGTISSLPLESGGVIAVDADGRQEMCYNSLGMFRGSCDSNGNCRVGIWSNVVSWNEECSPFVKAPLL